MISGQENGGATSSKKGGRKMIVLPITQLQMILSMAIAEVFLLSDPNYTVRIGSETYFSLAVGAFVASIFIFAFIAIKIGSILKFKDTVKEELIVNQS